MTRVHGEGVQAPVVDPHDPGPAAQRSAGLLVVVHLHGGRRPDERERMKKNLFFQIPLHKNLYVCV